MIIAQIKYEQSVRMPAGFIAGDLKSIFCGTSLKSYGAIKFFGVIYVLGCRVHVGVTRLDTIDRL